MSALTFSRREYLASVAALMASGAAAAPRMSAALKPSRRAEYIRPEQFGAKGDGVTNDTAAFAAMADYVNRNGGGAIALRATTYIVGQQASDPTRPGYYLAPAKIMQFDGCTRQLAILGNGARLKCADGLKFGTFDPATGQPTYNPMPYLGQGQLASPYIAMITVRNCSGGVDISDLELDGNVTGLVIGGKYGDTGWQIPARGLQLLDNNCSEQVSRVYTHHHAQDGFYVDGLADRNSASSIESVISEYNGRQGCSIVGGRNYSFSNCNFRHTGRSVIASAPGAGVDIEAEVKPIRNLAFSGCEFSNNAGCGLVADNGDSADVTFDSCRFVGTTSWSAWPKKPGFRFTGCQFVGAICSTYGDVDPSRAVQFSNCSFSDDPALSPTGQVYKASAASVNINTAANILFDGCRFNLTDALVLPYSSHALYNNCIMSQTATKVAYPRGTYTGTNQIDGNASLAGSTILGDVTLNGKLLARTA